MIFNLENLHKILVCLRTIDEKHTTGTHAWSGCAGEPDVWHVVNKFDGFFLSTIITSGRLPGWIQAPPGRYGALCSAQTLQYEQSECPHEVMEY